MGGVIGYFTPRPRGKPITVITPEPTATPTPTPAPLRVYVSGAVQAPDADYLPLGSLVKDAIYAAGGPAPEADLERINLGRQLQDRQQIYVPRRGTESPVPVISEGGPVQTSSAAVQSPVSIINLRADNAIPPRRRETSGAGRPFCRTKSGQHRPFRPVRQAQTRCLRCHHLILTTALRVKYRLWRHCSLCKAKFNNTATVEELQQLPRAGPVLAQGIVAYREMYGPFKSVEDLMKVSGIGEAIFAAIRDYITVGPLEFNVGS